MLLVALLQILMFFPVSIRFSNVYSLHSYIVSSLCILHIYVVHILYKVIDNTLVAIV